MSLARIQFVVHFADGEVIEGRPFLNAERSKCGVGSAECGIKTTPQSALFCIPHSEHSALGTGWRDLPDKPIARLSLVNPHGDLITLQGYEEYNFMVESLQALGMASYVSDIYVMGARDGKVTSYRMRLMRRNLSDPLQVGDIAVRVIDRGKEYLGAETTGWKSASGGMEERNVENPPSLRPPQADQGKLLGGGLKSSNV